MVENFGGFFSYAFLFFVGKFWAVLTQLCWIVLCLEQRKLNDIFQNGKKYLKIFVKNNLETLFF